VHYNSNSYLHVDKTQLQITSVVMSDFAEYIPIEGTVYPKNSIYIDAIQGGVIQKIFVEDGQKLHKGDVIIKLHNADMEIRFMEQETRIFDAINNLRNTQLSFERNKYMRQKEIVTLQFSIDKLKADFSRKQFLYHKKVIPLQEFEDAQRDYKEQLEQLNISLKLAQIDSISYYQRNDHINNSIDRMYNNLKLLRKNYNNLYVKAPADGILSSFQMKLGETVNAGQRLGQIDMEGGVLLKVNIDEKYIANVFVKQQAEYHADNTIYHLMISKIYTSVNKGVFQVDMVFIGNTPKHIKRGQSLQLRLLFSSPHKTLVIRRGGFFQETGGNWIFVLSPSGDYAVRRKITIGRQNSNYYEILDGLKEGEKVIISSYEHFGNTEKLILN